MFSVLLLDYSSGMMGFEPEIYHHPDCLIPICCRRDAVEIAGKNPLIPTASLG